MELETFAEGKKDGASRAARRGIENVIKDNEGTFPRRGRISSIYMRQWEEKKGPKETGENEAARAAAQASPISYAFPDAFFVLPHSGPQCIILASRKRAPPSAHPVDFPRLQGGSSRFL